MDTFEAFLEKVRGQVPSSYTWERDDRMNAWLVVINMNDSEQIKGSIAGLFGNTWDSSSLDKASKPEKAAAKSFGGIQKGQLLFTVLEGDSVFFGAWWPWGDGTKVSLRVGRF